MAVIVFILMRTAVYGSHEKDYDRELSLGARYVNELDYEKAIAAYRAAIEIEPKNPEAYEALADLYILMGDYEAAATLLNEGIKATGSDDLYDRLAEINVMTAGMSGENDDKSDDAAKVGCSVAICVMAANETGPIKDAELKLSGLDADISAKTDESGVAVFTDVAAGEYTVSCIASGYNSLDRVIRVSEQDMSPLMVMVPEAPEDDAYVLITWEGDHDLDLCAFNTELKEYVTIGHPSDSDGNVFLYADNGADKCYEMMYIHNAGSEIVKTFYVTEAGNARNGNKSLMEADGVTIYVYDGTGLIYESTADPSESAPLWCPCYYYAGVIYDQQDYIYDTADEQYAWISFDEEDAYAGAEDEGWKRAYLDVILNDPDGVLESEYNSIIANSISYGLIYINDDEIPELAIRYLDYGSQDGHETVEIFSYQNGKAKLFKHDAYKFFPEVGNWIYQNYYYFEKKDYLSATLWMESPLDSKGEDFFPMFQSDNSSYTSCCFEYDSFSEDYGYEYEESWYRGETKITEAEYNSFVSSLGAKKKIEDECVSLKEMEALLSGGNSDDDWKNAYIAFIQNSDTDESDYVSNVYGLFYIDNDNIPELVIYSVDNTMVYEYREQAVKQIQSYSNMEAHGVSHYFYERSGYHGSVYAGDAGPDDVAPGCYSLDPVFDDGLSTYGAVEYGEATASYYYKNGNEISKEVYAAETSSIINHPCKDSNDGVSKAEILRELSK